MYDKGGHNSISYDEVKQSMTIIGEKHNDKEIDKVIKEADTDGDGEISFEEFKAVLWPYYKSETAAAYIVERLIFQDSFFQVKLPTYLNP